MFNEWSVTMAQYKIARRHLLEMPWVGLTEYLTESVEQLKIFWRERTHQGDKHENVNKKKPKKEIGQRILDQIAKFNEYDLALWDIGYCMYLQQEIAIKYAWDVDIDLKIEQAVHGKKKDSKVRKGIKSKVSDLLELNSTFPAPRIKK